MRQGMLGSILKSMPGLGDYLDQADVRMPPAQFAMICMGAFAVGVALCLASPFKLLAIFVGPMFAAVPFGWLMIKRSRRLAKFGVQMPEALELLGRSLRAGHSLNAGFGLVAKEMEDPLAREFGRAFEEQNLGIPFDEAIEDMADRVPNMDLRFFATAVILQRQTGGDLAEILDKIGHLDSGASPDPWPDSGIDGRRSNEWCRASRPATGLVLGHAEAQLRVRHDACSRTNWAVTCSGSAWSRSSSERSVIKKIITIKV